MGQNIEIKAKCADLQKVKNIVKERNWPGEIETQKDTFFNVPNGRLKLREINESRSVLIPYLRADVNTLRDSEYVLLKTDETLQTIMILSKMFGIRSIVKKNREIFFYDNIRIHLDEVESLGSFIELEGVITKDSDYNVTQAKLEELIKLFEIKSDDVFKEAYVDLLEKKESPNAY